MTFDPTKPVQTRRGRAVEILRILNKPLAESADTIIALVHDDDGTDLHSYKPDGSYMDDGEPSGLDLINVPQKHKRWVGAYRDDIGRVLVIDDYQGAPKYWKRIARIEIEFTEGEGL
jgi:hypothetical protein